MFEHQYSVQILIKSLKISVMPGATQESVCPTHKHTKTWPPWSVTDLLFQGSLQQKKQQCFYYIPSAVFLRVVT